MSKYKKYVTVGESNKEFTTYEVLRIENDEDGFPYNESGNKLATYSYIQEKLKSLTGKILTIVDASMPESKQSKCVKDLMRKEFLNMFSEVADDLLDMSRYPSLPDNIAELPQTTSSREILGA